MSIRFYALLLTTGILASAPAVGAQQACVQLSDGLPAIEPSDDPRLILDADHVDLTAEGGSNLLGHVHLRYGEHEFLSDQMGYDAARQRISVPEGSTFRSPTLTVRSRAAEFDLRNNSGDFDGTDFVLPQRPARGDAEHLTVDADGRATLQSVRYTTCAPLADAWYLEASKITLDHEEGLGTAKHARLRFYGVPVLYAPWFQFPIDDRRRSGLLFPTFGSSDRTGFDFEQPVYLNLAPNYDLTLTPRYMSDRGIQMAASGRYLWDQAQGSLGYEILKDRQLNDDTRNYLHFRHRGLINSRLGLDLRYAEVSDRAYFEDLGSSNIDLSAITHLERSARLTYNVPAAYRVQMLFQDYQPIASNLPAVDDPYRRLPQVRFDSITRNSKWNTRLGFDGEYVNFVRSSSVEGQRIDLHPYARWEKDQIAWFAKSQLDFRYTTYTLENTAPAQPHQQDRALPQISAESGLRFERITANGSLQTMAPQLYYLYVPYRNQDNLPIFDTGAPDFDITQLFSRNRFSGEDRLSDANQIAGAVTLRQLDADSGLVRASATFGQLYRFERPRVQLPGEQTPVRGATDFISAVDYALSEVWRLYADAQWSPQTEEFTRTSAAVRYRSGRWYAEAAYRFREALLEQTDLTVAAPVTPRLSINSRWRYSLRDNHTLDSFTGLRFETCCWAISGAYRRYVADTQGRFNSGVYLQLELKGLAMLGTALPGSGRDPFLD